jgi:XTP/dITP diphosphohydrolase
MKLVIATHNAGKKREYDHLLKGLGLEMSSLDDLGIEQDVEETGTTFAENALVKARFYCRISGLPTLADDSGLEVDALHGAPGVYSARYAGEDASDEDRYRLLLAHLAQVPQEKRTARFRCVIAIVWPDGRECTVEGACEGTIAHEPKGQNGFGYDPVFFVPAYGATMAELSPGIKNAISHRARAAQAARDLLHA